MTLMSGDEAALDGPPPAGTSPVGRCDITTFYGSNDTNPCIAAILEAPNATPVLMLTSLGWVEDADGAFFSCASPPDPISPCAPHLDPQRDPGPDALSLVAAGTGLAFQTFTLPRAASIDGGVVDQTLLPRIRIAPVDLAAIAARAPAPDGCRATRDAYHALLAGSSCTVDADCQGVIGPPIPGDPASCGGYVNSTMSAMAAQALTTAWVDNCFYEAYDCPTLRAPACNAGTCGEVCPGVVLPTCPSNCRDYDSTTDKVCIVDGSCLDDAGETCTCHPSLVCAPAPPVAPGCPLTCFTPGSMTLTPTPATIDAGSTNGCAAGLILVYDTPGCGARAVPVCSAPSVDACAAALCSCQGTTIIGCGVATEPFASYGACDGG
jgi:hypothetical protein